MIREILKSLENKKKILILTHNDPDPDSMGAAYGLKNLIHTGIGKKSTIGYKGMVSRAENRELIHQCKINMVLSTELDFGEFDHTIVVDSQPNFGNIYIPQGHKVNTIIDHHIIKHSIDDGVDLIVDIREDYGSSCTIISDYYNRLNVIPDENTATALCMGITTDAIGNARDSCHMDKQMLGFLFPYVSLEKIAKIQTPDLPKYHYRTISRAVKNAQIIENVIICDLENTENSELVAETADYLLRMKEVNIVFVVGNVNGTACFSLRHKSFRKSAGSMANNIVKGVGYGGGHSRIAGGQVPLSGSSYDDIVELLKSRLLEKLEVKSGQIERI